MTKFQGKDIKHFVCSECYPESISFGYGGGGLVFKDSEVDIFHKYKNTEKGSFHREAHTAHVGHV